MIVLYNVVKLGHRLQDVFPVRLYVIDTTAKALNLIVKQGFLVAVNDKVELYLAAVNVPVVVHDNGLDSAAADDADDL